MRASKEAPEHASVAARAKELGYELVDETAGGLDIWAPAEVANELRKARAIVVNDEALADFSRRYDKALQVWKAYKTLPIFGGLSFFSRNFQSNVFLNFIADSSYANPKLYADAMRYQRKLGKLTEVSEAAMKAAGLSDREAKVLMQAYEEGVIGRGFFATDLDELGKTLDTGSRAGRAAKAANPLSTDNIALRSGKKINSAIENNARLAHFLGALEKHGSTAEAAASVRKYLFDYGDLTAAEQKLFKRVLPFYTFMRKNTALMVTELAKNPRKATAIAHGQDRLLGSTEGLPPDVAVPDYASADGQMPLNDGLTGILTGGKAPVVGRLDDPLSSALDTLKPLLKGGALLAGKDVEGGASGVARDIANMPGGPLADLAKMLVEHGTGTDLFTGAPVKTDKKAVVESLVEALGPSVSKGKNLAAAKETLLGDATPKERARFINAFVGAAMTVVDEDATKSAQTRARFELEDVIADLKAKGRKVPTITELRDAGVVPDPDGRRNARSPRRVGGGSGSGGAFSRG
jgi:hypothetical protein